MGNSIDYFLADASYEFKRFQVREIARKIALNWIDRFNEGDYGVMQNLDKNNSLYLINNIRLCDKVKKFKVIKKDTKLGCLVVQFLSISGNKYCSKTIDIYREIVYFIVNATCGGHTIEGFPDVENDEESPISNEAAYEVLNNYLSKKLYIGLNPEYVDAVLLGEGANFDPMTKEKLIAKERKEIRDYNRSVQVSLKNNNDIKTLLDSFKKGSEFWNGSTKFIVQSISKNGKRNITAVSSKNKKPQRLTQSWFKVRDRWGSYSGYKIIYKSEPKKYTK